MIGSSVPLLRRTTPRPFAPGTVLLESLVLPTPAHTGKHDERIKALHKAFMTQEMIEGDKNLYNYPSFRHYVSLVMGEDPVQLEEDFIETVFLVGTGNLS